MKWFSVAVLVLTVFAFSPMKSADAGAFSFSVGFHDELSPYGSWVNYSNYGRCWRPSTYSGYRPYVDGYWNYSNYGPTWYGNEQWAPYTYNYGDWVYSARYGWIWIPGNNWHANRVQWSYGGGYIGWRPLFPGGYRYNDYGYGYDNYGYGSGYGNDFNFWIVIDANRFGHRSYRDYAYRSSFVRDLFQRRVFRNRYDRIDRRELERVVRQPIRTVSLRESDVRIGDRKARMLVTQDQEARIQKHVQQIRRNGNQRLNENDSRLDNRSNDRRFENKSGVMQRKYEDIRSRSSKDVRRDQEDRDRREFTRKQFERSDSRDSSKSYSTRLRRTVEEPEYQPPSIRSRSGDFDRRTDSVRRESIQRSEQNYSRKPSKVERPSYSVKRYDDNRRSESSIKKSDRRYVDKRRTSSKREDSRKNKSKQD